MGHGCRICQSAAVGTAVGVAVGSGSSHPAVVNVRKPTAPPNHTEARNPDFLSQHTSFTDGDTLLAAIHKEHTAGPTASIILTKLLQPIHAILSLYPGAPPNCFGRRLRS